MPSTRTSTPGSVTGMRRAPRRCCAPRLTTAPPICVSPSITPTAKKRAMPDFDYSDTDWDSIARLRKWYSGDVHDSMEQLGLWGHLEGISLLGSLQLGEVVCGPAVTV